MLEARWVQPRLHIRDAVIGKAMRYGDLDLPYVVAVNETSDYAEEEDAVDALFGSLAVVVRRTESGYEDKPIRMRDGAWYGARGPTNTRVSAVLSTERLTPWSVGQRRIRLIVNPWAQEPLPDMSLGVDVFRMQAPVLRRFAGKDLCSLFGLPEGWPE